MAFLGFFQGIIVLFWGFIFFLVVAVIHVFFALGVYRDAKRISVTLFVQPEIWLLATLLGGVLVATAYWLIHHSRLSPSVQVKPFDSDNDLL